MAYCDLAGLKLARQETDLIELTDDAGTLGEVNEDVTNDAIARADSEIDAALAVRYTLPLDPVPAILSRLSVDMTMYHLYARKRDTEIPEFIQARYRDCQKLLDQIKTGGISLGAGTGKTTGMYAL